MLDLASLNAIAITFFIAAASPGPANLALANMSLRNGRKAGLLFGLGLSVGLGFWGIIAAAGLGALLQASTYALTILKLLGGAYLLWLAISSARSAAAASLPAAAPISVRRSFLQGLLLNLSNPKAVFAWMAVLSLGLGQHSAAGHVGLATGLCMAMGFLIYSGYALIFSTAGATSVYARARRWIEGVVAGLFAIAGFALIRAAFVRQ